jgi:hypothetical protein
LLDCSLALLLLDPASKGLSWSPHLENQLLRCHPAPQRQHQLCQLSWAFLTSPFCRFSSLFSPVFLACLLPAVLRVLDLA